ncbi:MAG: DUF502 domain-containing protein [Pseudomonadaceae bacterium]|nr:DUF502 domain-containing protein [Pseudomonadaceae bacterium]
MMKSIAGTFFRGLTGLLPIALTLWLAFWVITTTEELLRKLFVYILPDNFYLPGLGIAFALLLIFATGLLMQMFVFKKLWDWFEAWLERVPLVKTVYQSVNDFFGFFSSNVSDSASKVACVDLGNGAQVVGFITDESLDAFADVGQDRVAIYLPMSYQVGGYTVLVSKADVEILDIPVEQAMRFVLTAGIRRQRPAD